MLQIKQTNEYIYNPICPICQDEMTDRESLVLIKHGNHLGRKEKKNIMYKRLHLFHYHCIDHYIRNESSKIRNQIKCPLDRDSIRELFMVNFYEVVGLNIINFAHDYYQLLNQTEHSHSKIVTVTFVDHVNLNHLDSNHKTLFYCACQRNDLKLMKLLIKNGASPIIPDLNGFTPIMIAISNNQLKIVRFLLSLPEVQLDINHYDVHNKTAIDYAIDFQNVNCLKLLLIVKGLNLNHLQNIIRKYQYLNPNDTNYHTALKIRQCIQKYLNKYMTH